MEQRARARVLKGNGQNGNASIAGLRSLAAVTQRECIQEANGGATLLEISDAKGTNEFASRVKKWLRDGGEKHARL
jgi:hypothetical protein